MNIASFPNPSDPASPYVNAYAWISYVAVDRTTGSAFAVLNIHPREAAWQAEPIAQLSVRAGEPFDPANPAVRFPSLQTLMANPTFAAGWQAIGQVIYEAWLSDPRLGSPTL